jgi:hypothetical protein
MKRAALILIRAYQRAVSPLLPPACRFYPSCSQYALEAIEQWGLVRGLLLGAKRLARCQPFGGHGIDPVPGREGSGIRVWRSAERRFDAKGLTPNP